MLAELKMIRALQMRVNRRTERYSKLIEGEQAENAELVEALRAARRAGSSGFTRSPGTSKWGGTNEHGSKPVCASCRWPWPCLSLWRGDRLWAQPADRPGEAADLAAAAAGGRQGSRPSPGSTSSRPTTRRRAKATELWAGIRRAADRHATARTAWPGPSPWSTRTPPRLVELCSQPKSQLLLPSQPWLTDPKTPPLVANNLRLLYGRWLVHEALFDEALEQLAGLKPDDVVAPAALLFYQGVVYHRLLDKEAGLKAIEQLLDGAEQSPRRYVGVAQLMQEDLEGLEDDTLDHIARRMDDIRRRLDLGRAGQKVRKVEDGVIESLDKLIKKLEEEQQQQQGSRQRRQQHPVQQPGPGQPDHRRQGPRRGDQAEDRLARAAGATCRPRSARRPCSRSAATSRPTTAT